MRACPSKRAHPRLSQQLRPRRRTDTPDRHTNSARVPIRNQEVHRQRQAMEDSRQRRQHMAINLSLWASSLATACLNSPDMATLPLKIQWPKADTSSLSMEPQEDTKLLLPDTQRPARKRQEHKV